MRQHIADRPRARTPFVDHLATLEHVITEHVQANTRPTKVELAEWRWLVQEVKRSSLAAVKKSVTLGSRR